MAPSYFPEETLKSEKLRIQENIEWAKKYGEPNRFYTLYGLDRIGSNPDDYMDYWNFMNSRNKSNHIGEIDSQVILLRDKFLFYKYMKSTGFPVPEVFAVMRGGKLYSNNFDDINLDFMKDKHDFFVKSLDGECASFIRNISDYTELTHLLPNLLKGNYIFQDRIVQAESMNVLNPYAVNTYRVVTVNIDDCPYVLAIELRCGTSKTKYVDNLARGGVLLGLKRMAT